MLASNKRFIRELLILLLAISVTGTMLSCTRHDLKSGAAFFCAQAAAPSEPVIGTVYADSFHGYSYPVQSSIFPIWICKAGLVPCSIV